MLQRLKNILNNELIRNEWVKNKLVSLPPGRILDLGCGSQQYRKYCSHLEYKGQDFRQTTSGLGTERIEYTYGALDYISNCWEVHEIDKYFDYVLCTEVLEHIPYPLKTLTEINRLLKNGGKLLLTLPSHSLRHFDPHWYFPGFSDNWLKKHLPEHGYRIDEITPVGDYYSWIFVELFRSIKFQKTSLFFNFPALLYYYIKSQKPSAEDIKLLTMGYHVTATKIADCPINKIQD